MSASFDFDPYPVPLAADACPVGVFRYDPDAPVDSRYAVVPNVRCESIQHREGPEPAVARFRYLLDDLAVAQGYPAQFEALWPIFADGPYVVRDDERIVVLATTPSGQGRVLFDGYAQVPEVELTTNSQRVSFLATSVAVRCWDLPIGGRLERNADEPRIGKAISVDLPTRFNPDGRPNCTPDGCDLNGNDPALGYPVFLDPNLDRRPDPRTYWTLGKLVRYILGVHNHENHVKNPDFTRLDTLLQVRAPIQGASFVDPVGGGNYSASDVVIRDFDASNSTWPDALAMQLGYAGFGMRFVTGEDWAGEPLHQLEIYRKDAAGPSAPRDLELPDAGSFLDPGRCNVGALHLARDSRSIINAVTVETRPRRVECSVVLAPGFSPAAGDETAASRSRFLRANLSTASGLVRGKYRSYIADEAGDGHWDAATGTWSTTALDLSAIFPDNDQGLPTYVRRLRPGSNTLISRDSEGRPLRIQLALSRDYAGPSPAVWNGTGTWQPISGGWELLGDRLGIAVTVEDPEMWSIGDYTGASSQEPSQTLRGITSQANPSAPNARFVLRLTTVIDDDLMLPAVTAPRAASPTAFARRRRVDARDHFALETVAPGSLYNSGSRPLVHRDDTEKALAHARQLRAAHEFPPLIGNVRIPSLITAFRIGDRIARINGRDISFQTNVGGGQGESPVYPSIVGLTWDFSGEQQATIIELADHRPD